ncbi:MAG: glycosyltransferase [Actinobacteria bacterium]|nr:MAG: glycosyltransferase [Actinomycetota bacterium]
MRLALFHGYELAGSGSNEYTRYLARALADAGHEVHVLCREPGPGALAGVVDAAVAWEAAGGQRAIFGVPGGAGTVTVHQLPHASVRPVYVTDKQRPGNVKAFTDLTDDELAEVRSVATAAVGDVLAAYPVDLVHANHLVLQPTIAADACARLGIPFVIYPHGSDIEYTVRLDERYLALARVALADCAGIITGSREMIERLVELDPDAAAAIRAKTAVVGVGVDVSLFAPVAPADRSASVQSFAATEPGGGKTQGLSAELGARLDDGELAAVLDYREAYAHELPDDDVAQRMTSLPWGRGRMALFVGALTVGKGLQSVIAAWPRVLQQVPDAHLVIVGSGSYREVLEGLVHAIAAGDAKLLDALVESGNDLDGTHASGPWLDVEAYLATPAGRAAALGAGPEFAHHIHFTGRLDHSRLDKLFPCADLAIFPSVLPEAYPLVLMESMASGVLPAASDLTGLGEGLDLLEPHLGIDVVQRLRLPMDPQVRVAAIAERVAALLADDDVRGLTDELRRIAVAEYDWSVRAAQMTAAYLHVLHATSGRS